MVYTREQLEYLKNVEKMAALRDLNNTYGWEIYSYLAHQRIDQMAKDFLQDGLTRDEIVEKHTRLKAVGEFQAMMDDLVREAVRFVDPMEIELALYSLNQPPEV
jgi:hypothetical protein